MADGSGRVNSIVLDMISRQDTKMNRLYLISLIPLLGLAACAPLETYYRPGVSVSAMQRQTTNCEVSALRDVPVSTQIRRTPPQYIPHRRICNSEGKCRSRGGYYMPGEIYSYDANAGLRGRVERQCMADKGYVPVSIPPCPDNVSRAAPAGATRILPQLTSKSCVIRNRDGSFQIVTRG